MPIFVAIVLFMVGLALIVKGGDIFIDAAGWVSEVTGISRAVIGATIVSFATTAPEYFVSTIAVLKGANDLSVGNAVGSLMCNLGLAFALLALATPGPVQDRQFAVKGLILLAASGLLWLFCLNGVVSTPEGLLLLLVFALFTFINIRYAKDGEEDHQRRATTQRETLLNVAKFVGGAAAIVYGSNLIVDNAQILAHSLGVPEAVIGLTVVAVGTALPETVTSVAAIIKKQNAISIGNIIGANVLDSTLILATGAFISPNGLAVSAATARLDLPATLLLTFLAVLPTALGRKIYRWQGALLLAVYAAYLLFVTMR